LSPLALSSSSLAKGIAELGGEGLYKGKIENYAVVGVTSLLHSLTGSWCIWTIRYARHDTNQLRQRQPVPCWR